MPRKTKEETEKTRRSLIDAALEVFSEKGFTLAKLEDIAKKVGLTRGAIYWHFKDKTELFLALADEIDKSTGIDTKALASTRAQSLKDYRNFIIDYFSLLEKNERFRKFYKLVHYQIEWNDELKPILKQHEKETKMLIESARLDFELFRERGLVDQSVDPTAAAIAVNAFISGLVDLWLLDQTLFSTKKEIHVIVDRFLNGFKVKC